MGHVIEADITTAITIHALGGIAVYYACQRALTLHLESAKPPSPRPPRESKWTSRLITAAVLLGFACVVGSLIVGLTWFASRTVKDWVYMGMSIGNTSLAIEYFFRKGIPKNVVDVYAIPKQLVFTFSAALAAIGIAAVYNGYQWALSPLVAVTAFAIITGQMGDARSVKSQMQWLVIIPLGCVVSVGALTAGKSWYNSLSGSTSQTPKSSSLEISGPEVALMISMFSAVVPLSVPGTLLATTLRYEHKAADKSRSRGTDRAAEPRSTKTPLYNAGIRTYFFVLIALCGAELFAGKEVLRVLRGMHSVCMTSIPVVTRLGILARQRGVYEEFMGYNDRDENGAEQSEGHEKALKQTDEEHAFTPLVSEKDGLERPPVILATT